MSLVVETFTTTGAGTWTAPPQIELGTIQVECYGPGGTGGAAGHGAGGGGYAKANAYPVTAGSSYSYIVGAVGSNTTFDGAVIGGKGTNGGGGGTGGSGSGGDVNSSGGTGGAPSGGQTAGGGGGASGSSAGTGANGADGVGTTGGAGGAGVSGGGTGGTGAGLVDGTAATSPGGGGSGASVTNAVGAPATGKIILTYTVVDYLGPFAPIPAPVPLTPELPDTSRSRTIATILPITLATIFRAMHRTVGHYTPEPLGQSSWFKSIGTILGRRRKPPRHVSKLREVDRQLERFSQQVAMIFNDLLDKGYILETSVGEFRILAGAFEMTRAPTGNDDFAAGFVTGCTWIDTSTTPRTAYLCLDDTIQFAVWRPIT